MELFQTIIFFCAIVHALFSDTLLKIARDKKIHGSKESIVTTMNFLGNITIIFGLWLVPIVVAMWLRRGPEYTYEYLHSFDIKAPFAYFALTTLGFLHPIRHLFANLLFYVSKLRSHHLAFWWSALLIISTILTGCFSEMGVMTLACCLLSTTFFTLRPSNNLCYLTLTLLLIGLAAGGTILPLNLRFSLEVFQWDHSTIFNLYGWKILVAFTAIVACSALCFRKEFAALQQAFNVTIQKELRPIIFREWFYAFLLFVAAVAVNHTFVLFAIVALVIVLHKSGYKIHGEEGEIHLKVPIFIAFFTYTLEIHARMQLWWVQPLIEQMEGLQLYGTVFFLTGLNELIPFNALQEVSIKGKGAAEYFSYLAILVGGGLTIFATSANVIAKKVLGHRFPYHAISPIKHILWAIPIGAIMFGLVSLLTIMGL